MKTQLMSAKERLKEIVAISSKIFQAKIVNENIGNIENEASMQLQLGIILQSVGRLYEWSPKDRFLILFEKVLEIPPTRKSSNGKARCDIYMEMHVDGEEKPFRVGIELKYLPKNKDEATTDNRLAILADIDNLEAYQDKNYTDLGYSFVYTTNENYARSDTRSSINIGNNVRVNGGKSNYSHVELKGTYTFSWHIYNTENSYKTKHCFLLLPVDRKIV